jgi:CPA2 family monovalent cation:H+ antiporter-2
LLPRLLLYLVAAFAVPVGASLVAQGVPMPPVAYWLAVGIVMAPILFGLAYTIDRILWDVIALNVLPWKEETEHAEEARDVIHDMMRVVLVIICGLPLLMLGALFVPFVSISVSAVGLIAVSSLIFWGSARRFHEHLERIVLGIFEPEAPLQAPQVRRAHDDLVQLIREEYPWDVETQDVVLPYQESAVNQTIKALQLRMVTGATVVAIYRGEESLVNPSPEVRLMPGDVVLCMGSQAQLAAAAQLLQRKMQEPPVTEEKAPGQAKTQRVEVTRTCAWVGKTLGALNLRRNTGVHVVGIQRAGAPMTNPDAEVVLQEGDLLFLFGLEDQLERAQAYLTQGLPPSERGP